MKRVRCLTHVMGVPAGDGLTTVTYQAGEVVELTEDQYDEVAWRRNPRTREPWIVDAADTPIVRCTPCGRDFAAPEIDVHRAFAHRMRVDRLPAFTAVHRRSPPAKMAAAPGAFPCEIEGCDRSFTTEHGRNIHASKMHDVEFSRVPIGGFVCRGEGCGRSFETHQGRRCHEGQAGHGPERAPRVGVAAGDYACGVPGCGRSFRTDHGRKTHQGRVHGIRIGFNPYLIDDEPIEEAG